MILREIFIFIAAFAAFASAVAAYLAAFHGEATLKEVLSTAFAAVTQEEAKENRPTTVLSTSVRGTACALAVVGWAATVLRAVFDPFPSRLPNVGTGGKPSTWFPPGDS